MRWPSESVPFVLPCPCFSWPLCRCCSRLRSFIQEKTLWINADFRRKPLQAQQILKRLKFLNTDTKSLALRGMYSFYPLDKYKNVTITSNMLGIVRETCPQLEHLEIIDGYLDTDKVYEGFYRFMNN
jgi:hypothetical protein